MVAWLSPKHRSMTAQRSMTLWHGWRPSPFIPWCWPHISLNGGKICLYKPFKLILCTYQQFSSQVWLDYDYLSLKMQQLCDSQICPQWMFNCTTSMLRGKLREVAVGIWLVPWSWLGICLLLSSADLGIVAVALLRQDLVTLHTPAQLVSGTNRLFVCISSIVNLDAKRCVIFLQTKDVPLPSLAGVKHGTWSRF